MSGPHFQNIKQVVLKEGNVSEVVESHLEETLDGQTLAVGLWRLDGETQFGRPY